MISLGNQLQTIMDESKAMLQRRIYRDPEGQPLKTALANKFPLLSRRQRRELMRSALKAQSASSVQGHP